MLDLQPLRTLSLAQSTHTPGRRFLSAASGLVCAFGRVYVVGDDEHHLAIFDDAHRPGRTLRLFEGELPAHAKQRKQRKPDTETLVLLHSRAGQSFLVALGSGSRTNRCRAARVPLDREGNPQQPAQQIDLLHLYAPLRRHFEAVNIEGALVCGDELILLQRGNRGGAVSASLHYRRDEAAHFLLGGGAPPGLPTIRTHALGEVDGTPLSFTDGTALPDGRWLFTAVAEATDDAVADGPCLASAVGLMSARHELLGLHFLRRREKVEGIAARLQGGHMDLALVTDHDDPAQPSMLLRGQVESWLQ
jgi:hypothetical protein